jgi:hypothetical protein
MISRIRGAPILEYAPETALGKMGVRHVFRHISEAEPGQRRIEHLERAVEDKLPFDVNL